MKERIILVDDENLGGAQEDTGRLDFKNFFKLLSKGRKTRIFYYFRPRDLAKREEIAPTEDIDSAYLGWLEFLFNDLRPTLEKAGISFEIFPVIRGDIDSKIISGITRLLLESKDDIGEIMLVSGDGGFAEILSLAKEEGIRISIVASKRGCSPGLVEVAHKVYFIEDMVAKHPQLIRKLKTPN